MLAEFLNRGVVLDQLAELRETVSWEIEQDRLRGVSAIENERLLDEIKEAERRERERSSGQPSFEPLIGDDRRGMEPTPLDDFSFFSRDPIISLFQSALNALYDEPAHTDRVKQEPPVDDRRGENGVPLVSDRSLKDAPLPGRSVEGRRLFEKFSITDVQWVRSKLAEGIRLFRDKHAFNPRPAAPFEIADRVRLILVGDWGSGLPRAQKVAQYMRRSVDEAKDAGVPVHVIHLGDVYYSGWSHEYTRRFLAYWPVSTHEMDAVRSWCLNGNHDMYSGGHAYYDVALGDPRFARQEKSSFFSLVNRHWKVLGLDTAWDDGGLKEPQADWLKAELIGARGRKALLLSHHQLFSAYEKICAELSEKIAPILARHPIRAWFWGHEHRCMLFKGSADVAHARCIGHGGVPVYMWHKDDDLYPNPGLYEYRRFIQNGLERWGLLGFAVLDFDGPIIGVRYVDETGYVHKQEEIS